MTKFAVSAGECIQWTGEAKDADAAIEAYVKWLKEEQGAEVDGWSETWSGGDHDAIVYELEDDADIEIDGCDDDEIGRIIEKTVDIRHFKLA